MQSHEDLPGQTAEQNVETVRREWTAPRFEIIDIACETQSNVGAANDTDQLS